MIWCNSLRSWVLLPFLEVNFTRQQKQYFWHLWDFESSLKPLYGGGKVYHECTRGLDSYKADQHAIDTRTPTQQRELSHLSYYFPSWTFIPIYYIGGEDPFT